MLGLQAIRSWRLQGGALSKLWIEVQGERVPPAGVWMLDGQPQALLAIEPHETAPRCDLRIAAGLPVVVAAPTWQQAWPFFDAVCDHRPASATLIADDMAAVWTADKGLATWEL